jgi:RsiW-degrading membrane proteinase PrsW (M82 family)
VTLQYALSRERGPLFWRLVGASLLALFLAGGIVTAGVAAIVSRDALVASGVGRVVAAAIISLIPVAGVTALIAITDRYEREPWFLLTGAFLWGALVAIPTTMFFEQPVSAISLRVAGGAGVAHALAVAGFQASAAAIVEECCKGAGFVVLLLTLWDQFDNVTDGVLYGAAIGAGFGLVENYVYFALSPRADVQLLFAGRILLGWLGHSTYTGMLGAALGYARERHQRGLVWWGLAVGLVLAIALHALFDFAIFSSRVNSQFHLIAGGTVAAATVVLALAYLPLFIEQSALFAVLRAALAREATVVREYLAAEVVSGYVTPDEYVLVQHATLRARAEWYLLAAGGARHYLTARALYQSVIGLAFRKWHVASGDPPKRGATQPEDVYRERISRLRVALWGQTGGPADPMDAEDTPFIHG